MPVPPVPAADVCCARIVGHVIAPVSTWLAACAAGGALGMLRLGTSSFLGGLFLFGGLVGTAQAGVSRPSFRVDTCQPSVPSALVWMRPWVACRAGAVCRPRGRGGPKPRHARDSPVDRPNSAAVGAVWRGLSDVVDTTLPYRGGSGSSGCCGRAWPSNRWFSSSATGCRQRAMPPAWPAPPGIPDVEAGASVRTRPNERRLVVACPGPRRG